MPTAIRADKSVSVFGPEGDPVALYKNLDLDFEAPQGMDYGSGKMYLTGCGSNTLATASETGEFEVWEIPEKEGRPRLQEPFDTAFYLENTNIAQLWVSGNSSKEVGDDKVGAIYVVNFAPINDQPPYEDIESFYGDEISWPLGIDTDSQGVAWVANSRLVDIPCGPEKYHVDSNVGWVSSINYKTKHIERYQRGGLGAPWGLWIDSQDNVWISNFSSQKISRLCANIDGCRGGIQYGEFFVDEGYRFLGYERLTATRADPSDNLWAANNWIFDFINTPSSPGGSSVVAIIGMANPEKGQGPEN
ncbi:hypothetical protein [Shewanella surugensis]|uniref:SMP-30/Gluconolactonase/LRE-like region domain-containing protein n=1 Tax=Shewanella surugensis TaxID=212020 RepID=A0ABT0LAP2_9GAMM|nr:hypothetical protein [Shewanella surugensis]MCL1124560.1 hypothetical protein [Shewanella surugensis]